MRSICIHINAQRIGGVWIYHSYRREGLLETCSGNTVRSDLITHVYIRMIIQTDVLQSDFILTGLQLEGSYNPVALLTDIHILHTDIRRNRKVFGVIPPLYYNIFIERIEVTRIKINIVLGAIRKALPLSENACPNPDYVCAFFDRDLKIRRHSHGKELNNIII